MLSGGVHQSAREKGERGYLAGPTGQRERASADAGDGADSLAPPVSGSGERQAEGEGQLGRMAGRRPARIFNLFLLIKSRNSNKFK